MALRLITFISKVGGVLKHGHLTVKIVARVQPRYSDLRQLLSQSHVYFSHERYKALVKIIRPNGCKNGAGATKMKGRETADKKNIHKRIMNYHYLGVDNTFKCRPVNASSTSRPKSAPKDPFQGSKFGRGGDRKINSHEPDTIKISIYFKMSTGVIMIEWWRSRKISYEEIAWKDFADDYLARGRVVKVEVINGKWLRAHVHTALGSSADVDKKTVWLRIDSLDSHEIVAHLAKILENPRKEAEAEPEMDVISTVEEELQFSIRIPFIAVQITGRRRTTISKYRIPKNIDKHPKDYR